MVLQRSKVITPCVILTEGAIGQSVGMIRSIGRRGIPVYLLIVPWDAKSASILGKSRYCKAVHTISATSNANEVCENALMWLKKQHFPVKPVLIPINDKLCTYVAQCRARFSEKFDVCMASNDVVLGMLDKKKAHLLVKGSGLTVPETFSATSLAELESVVHKCGFPVIVKPLWWRERGKRNFKAERCDTQAQLFDVGGQLIENGATLLVQAYIPGDDDTFEVYMFYRTRDGHTIHGCTGQKLRQIPPSVGNMASGRATVLSHVTEMSNMLLKHIDYRGLGGIEYKRNGQTRYFIEMSVRPEGFHMLAMKAGIDLPWLAYSDMIRSHTDHRPNAQRDACYINIRSYISLWNKYRSEVPVFREMLKVLFIRRIQFDLWSWRDPMPWLLATKGWLNDLLTRTKTTLFRNAK